MRSSNPSENQLSTMQTSHQIAYITQPLAISAVGCLPFSVNIELGHWTRVTGQLLRKGLESQDSLTTCRRTVGARSAIRFAGRRTEHLRNSMRHRLNSNASSSSSSSKIGFQPLTATNLAKGCALCRGQRMPLVRYQYRSESTNPGILPSIAALPRLRKLKQAVTAATGHAVVVRSEPALSRCRQEGPRYRR